MRSTLWLLNVLCTARISTNIGDYMCELVVYSERKRNHASKKTDSVRVVNGRDVTNQMKFSRVAHRQFDGTWLAFQCNHASNVINEAQRQSTTQKGNAIERKNFSFVSAADVVVFDVQCSIILIFFFVRSFCFHAQYCRIFGTKWSCTRHFHVVDG